MWTRANRAEIAAIEKKTKRYPIDLTDEEWERIEPFLLLPARKRRKTSVDLREVLMSNSIE
ncbi:transposase [Methylocapsa acidiphila]|uniref:transposase n=1 Tax=Methylocapsa acidiphila TaxID=133552 RepID=UPI00047DC090